jgi:hypothetical protein
MSSQYLKKKMFLFLYWETVQAITQTLLSGFWSIIALEFKTVILLFLMMTVNLMKTIVIKTSLIDFGEKDLEKWVEQSVAMQLERQEVNKIAEKESIKRKIEQLTKQYNKL